MKNFVFYLTIGIIGLLLPVNANSFGNFMDVNNSSIISFKMSVCKRSRVIPPTLKVKSTSIRLGTLFKNGSKKDKEEEVESILEQFMCDTGLKLSKSSLLRIGEKFAKGDENIIIWDVEGYHESLKSNEVFQNRIHLKFKNKSDNFLETKIILALKNKKKIVFKRQYTLKISPQIEEIIDLSHTFRNLIFKGDYELIYDLKEYTDKIKIISDVKRVYITDLIVKEQ